ncbi:MAG: nucleoside diphosphate kinase regulator [Hyphomicrobiaceae bacterium]|nr:nucleoside diphosphate kinase regulator [Hyphomicrobiaceae bacterium]
MKDRHYPEMPDIIVSQADQQRLTVLAMDALHRSPDVAGELIAEMERARVVAAVPPSVVQMGSTLAYRSDDGRERRVKLVFPGQADIGAGRISILTPIGTALIGLSEGQSIAWTGHDGRERHLTVLQVDNTTASD